MNNLTIVFNSSNYDSNRGVFSYKISPQRFENKKVALTHCSVYKQWENITSAYSNNTFTITWLNSTINAIIPDGNYTVSQINDYIQYVLYSNGLYLINSANSASIVSYMELVINPTQYCCQLNFTPIPTSSQATALGYTQSSGVGWVFPSTATCPSITFGSNFGSLIGFNSGTFGGGSAITSINSSLTPKIAKVTSLIIRSNLLNSEYTNPNDVLSAMDINGEYGDLMTKNIGTLLYSNISSNNFNEILVYFSDQDLNKLTFKDTQICIILSIVDK
jgi:hypothetical protein